jgi:hypothetical protein
LVREELARNGRARWTGAHQRARTLDGRVGVNGIARRQQRVRAWSGLVSINGRARQRVRA